MMTIAITTLRVRWRSQDSAARATDGSAAGSDGTGGVAGSVGSSGPVGSPVSISFMIDGQSEGWIAALGPAGARAPAANCYDLGRRDSIMALSARNQLSGKIKKIELG